MRRAGLDIMPVAARLARDADAGVRREVALSMRDQPAAAALDILVDVARGFDGQDRSYLEALGTGATGKEPALYDRLRRDARREGRSDRMVRRRSRWIAWRLHVPAAVSDLVGACAVINSCRSPTAGWRSTRSRSSTIPPHRRRCSAFAAAEQPVA